MSGNVRTESNSNADVSIKVTEAPIPLSFPAILRNPLLSDRYAHLRPSGARASAHGNIGSTGVKANLKKGRRDDNEGKRWIRRKENGQFPLSTCPQPHSTNTYMNLLAKFSGNPHIIPASKKDLSLPPTYIRRTFPEPLPTYLSRNTHLPTLHAPTQPDPVSANAGRFSLSLKGMRRELRKMGGRAESLVRDVEAEITAWLQGGVALAPSSGQDDDLRFPGAGVKGRDDLREVGRNVLQLVWFTDDALVRYVVHCCARYHDIVSFSMRRFLYYLLFLSLTDTTIS